MVQFFCFSMIRQLIPCPISVLFKQFSVSATTESIQSNKSSRCHTRSMSSSERDKSGSVSPLFTHRSNDWQHHAAAIVLHNFGFFALRVATRRVNIYEFSVIRNTWWVRLVTQGKPTTPLRVKGDTYNCHTYASHRITRSECMNEITNEQSAVAGYTIDTAHGFLHAQRNYVSLGTQKNRNYAPSWKYIPCICRVP